MNTKSSTILYIKKVQEKLEELKDCEDEVQIAFNFIKIPCCYLCAGAFAAPDPRESINHAKKAINIIIEELFEQGMNDPLTKIIREFITKLKEEPTQPFSLPDDLEGGHC